MQQPFLRDFPLAFALVVAVLQPPVIQAFDGHALRQQGHQRHQPVADHLLLDKGIAAQANARHHHQHKALRGHLDIGRAAQYAVQRMVGGGLPRAIGQAPIELYRQGRNGLGQQPHTSPDRGQAHGRVHRYRLAATGNAEPLLPEHRVREPDRHAQPLLQRGADATGFPEFCHYRPTMIGSEKKPSRSPGTSGCSSEAPMLMANATTPSIRPVLLRLAKIRLFF